MQSLIQQVMKLNHEDHHEAEGATCECERQTNSDSYCNDQC